MSLATVQELLKRLDVTRLILEWCELQPPDDKDIPVNLPGVKRVVSKDIPVNLPGVKRVVSKAGLAILPGPGFPTPGKTGLGNNAFLTKVGNNGQ